MAVAGEEILIGAAHRPLQQTVAHRPAVDEKKLLGRGRLVEGRQTDIAGKLVPFALGIDGQRILGELAAHHRRQPLQPRRIGIGHQVRRWRHSAAPRDRRPEGEGDLGMGHGEALHHLLGMAELAAGGFQEFEPRRGGEEEIGQIDPGPAAERGRLGAGLGPGLDGQAPGFLGPLLAAGDGEPPDGADGGQRLAAKSQGGDMGQIVARQLGGGVALHRQGQLLGRHAEPVIHHLDQIAPAVPEGDIDAPGAGVDGILH